MTDAGLKVISFTGGEPILHKDFKQFVKAARDKKVLLSLNSNGLLIEKNIDFIKKHFYQVVISLDGPPSYNDLYRGNGSADKAISAIRLLQKTNLNLVTTTVITENTIDRIDELLEFAKKEDIPLSFQFVFDKSLVNFEPVKKPLDENKISEALDLLIHEKRRGNKYVTNSLKTLLFLRSSFRKRTPKDCRAGKFFMRIEPNGDIKKCGRVKPLITYKNVLNNGVLKTMQDLQNFDLCTICLSQMAIKANI